jgi:hypothetical protein
MRHTTRSIWRRLYKFVFAAACPACAAVFYAAAQGMQQMMRDFRLPVECISFQLLQVAQDPVATSTFSLLDAQFSNCVDTTGPYACFYNQISLVRVSLMRGVGTGHSSKLAREKASTSHRSFTLSRVFSGR